MDNAIFAQVRKTDQCQSGWDINKNRLAVGAFGGVYNACCKGDCEYIAKIIAQKYGNNFAVLKEIEFQNKAAEKNISIPVLDHYHYKKFYIMIMKSLHMTLAVFIRNVKSNSSIDEEEKVKKISDILCILIEKIYKLVYELNIDHNDISYDNIMMDKNEEPFIIDFGTSRTVDRTGINDPRRTFIRNIDKLLRTGLLLYVRNNELSMSIIKRLILDCKYRKIVITLFTRPVIPPVEKPMPPVEKPIPPVEKDNYDKMKVVELREIAKKKKLSKYLRLRKHDLIKLIRDSS